MQEKELAQGYETGFTMVCHVCKKIRQKSAYFLATWDLTVLATTAPVPLVGSNRDPGLLFPTGSLQGQLSNPPEATFLVALSSGTGDAITPATAIPESSRPLRQVVPARSAAPSEDAPIRAVLEGP